MPKLYNWYILDKGNYYVAHGNVVGSDRFQDSLKIHTSKIEKVDISDELVKIHTKNTVYQCNLQDCLFWNQKPIKLLPVNLDELAKKYNKEYQTIKDSVLLVLTDHNEYYFDKAVVNRDGESIDLPMYVNVGMFQDSCLIGDADKGGKYDVRYFPHQGNVEFYLIQVDELPVYLSNAGDHPLCFRTEYGIIEVPAGEQKRMSAKNTLEKDGGPL